MSGGLRVGRILGIPIFLHSSSLLLVGLLVWVLAGRVAVAHPGWGESGRFGLALLTSLLFLASILLHELGHAVLALRHGVPVRSITLFVFGGLAAMDREADHPRAEFEIAIAGPLASALLALAFTALGRASGEGSAGAFAGDLLGRLNLAVALFNLLPGFPLDGGRLLRALLWARHGDLARATRTAAGGGRLLGWGLVGLGVASVLGGGAAGAGIGGIWIVLVGALVITLAGSAGRRADLDVRLRGLRAEDLLEPAPAGVPAETSIAGFLRGALAGRRWALVEREGQVVGLVTQEDAKRVSPDDWETTPVARVAIPAHRVVTATPETPLPDLMQAMGGRGVERIPVVREGHIVGVVTRAALERALDSSGSDVPPRSAEPPPDRRSVL